MAYGVSPNTHAINTMRSLTIVCDTHYSVIMETRTAFIHAQRQEISRGSVVIAVLWTLRTPQYGYALLDTLNSHGIVVEANTLYPLLRRLEQQGMLHAEWNTDEARPRKYYVTTEEGNLVVTELLASWQQITASLDTITEKDPS